jgi:hypothetical protein
MLRTTSQKIRATLWVVILLGFNPWVIEGMNSNCGAVDRALSSHMKSPITLGLIGAANGHFTEAMIRARTSDAPEGLVCAYLYWNAKFNPPVVR